MNPGLANRRALFERRDTTADAYGNVTAGSWAPIVTVWGSLQFERGRERLDAGRMESAIGAVLKVRSSTRTRAITPADRVTIDGAAYAIRTIAEPPRSGMIEMTIERGVAG